MIGGIQWTVAAMIAVVIHVLGLLWLSLAPPTRQPQLERSGEGVVVTLGRSAGDAARRAEAVSPVEGTQVKAASASPAPSAAEAPPVRQPQPADQDAAQSGRPVQPQPASAPPLAQSRPVAAATAGAEQATEVAALAPQPASPAALDETPQPVAAATVRAQEAAASRPAGVPVKEAAPESEETVPVEAPADAASPEQAETTVNTAKVSTQEVRAVQADQPAAKPQIEAAETQSASEAAGVEIAAAREPAPEVEQASPAKVVEAEKPRTVDLEKLLQAEEAGSAGSGGGNGVMARYAGVLKGWLQKNMHYPRAARLAGQEGKVVVRFIIDRDGKVKSVKLESRSGFPLLDREAREMIERGDPFPAIPNEMPGQELEIRVPVSFHVRQDTLTKEIPPINLQ